MLQAQNYHELDWQKANEPKEGHVNGFAICQKVVI